MSRGLDASGVDRSVNTAEQPVVSGTAADSSGGGAHALSTAPNRVVEGYTHIIGSSSLGSCIKAQVAAFLGYEELPTSERMQALYDRGSAHEDECILALQADGWSIGDRQREEVIDCGDEWGVVIHYDGMGENMLTNRHQSYVIEVKSPSTWHSFERAVKTANFSDPYMNRIAWQVSAQMVASGLECVVACVEEGVIRTFGIEVPIYTATEIQARVQTIREYVSLGDMPEACSSNDFPCDFKYLHVADDREELEDEAVIEAATEYARLTEIVAAGTAADKERKKLRAPLDALLPGKYAAGLTYVTRSAVAGKSYLSEDAMREDGIDPEKYRRVGAETYQLRVTPRGED